MRQVIDIGSAPGAGDGEDAYDGFDKANDNFIELFAARGLKYVSNSSDQDQSLRYLTGVQLGDSVRCNHWSVDQQDGSTSVWRCVKVDRSDTPDTLVADSLYGLLYIGEGTSGSRPGWALTAPPGNMVDIRALGIKCDGTTSGQHSRLQVIFAASVVRRWKLVGAGTFMATETIDGRTINCDFSMLLFQFGQASSATGTPGGFTYFYTGGVGGSQAGITTDDITLWDGSTRRLGVGIRGGGNASNSTNHEQKWFAWGDGNFDLTRTSTVMLVRWEDDDSPLANYKAECAYGCVGVGLAGAACEKHSIQNNVIYCEWAAYNLGTSSADTLIFNLHSTLCRYWYWETEGVSTSVRLFLNCEDNREDVNGGPAVWIRNGKQTEIGGRWRSKNGYLGFLIDKTTSVGVDSVFWNNFSFIHGYGLVILVDRLRHMYGNVFLHDIAPDNTSTGSTASACVQLNRVADAGNFHLHMDECTTREGVRIGDVSKGYYPLDCNFGSMSIVMGTTTPWNSNGTESGSFPTTLTAVAIEKMKGGSLTLSQCKGKVVIGADPVVGAQGKAQIFIPRTATRYTHTNAATAAVEVLTPDGTVVV